MTARSEWDLVRIAKPSRLAEAGSGIMRATLLFGSAAIAIAMFAVPALDRATRSDTQAASLYGLDTMSTGSVRRDGETITIRRSVLQSSPDAVCVIRENGSRRGAC
ncbi:MAG: hypothetical protein DI629_15895 [Mesorhizobium amorphae]|nr:MAG: hypothetical protein DI629_15895 [Mesorhizobium amorphae]